MDGRFFGGVPACHNLSPRRPGERFAEHLESVGSAREGRKSNRAPGRTLRRRRGQRLKPLRPGHSHNAATYGRVPPRAAKTEAQEESNTSEHRGSAEASLREA